jgi:hypothetical protein
MDGSQLLLHQTSTLAPFLNPSNFSAPGFSALAFDALNFSTLDFDAPDCPAFPDPSGSVVTQQTPLGLPPASY